MFAAVLVVILALQGNAVYQWYLAPDAPGRKPETPLVYETPTVDQLKAARQEAMFRVLECSKAKADGTRVDTDPDNDICRKEVDAFNAISADYLKATGGAQ